MGRRSKRLKSNQLSNNQKSSASFDIKITNHLDENMNSIKTMLGEPDDLVIREINSENYKFAIVYIDGLVDTDLINNNILKMIQEKMGSSEFHSLTDIYNNMIAIANIKIVKTLDDVSLALLSGSTAFYLDGQDTVILIGTETSEKRAIDEPTSESLVRGPKDGFIENLNTNIALIRNDIKDPNLRLKTHYVGKRSKQRVVVSYIDGIINDQLVDEVNRRLASIGTDFVLDSGEVEQWIQDSFLSPFPQLIDTERPDRVTQALMEGRVAILVEGTPFTLIAPITFSDSMLSMEDYSQRWLTSSVIRLLRYVASFFAIFSPSLYIALVSFHPDLLPSQLVFTIQAAREGVPFPAVIEALLMAITFEILHEAGIRLPKIIGSTIGIVGGLVIGEAAVTAGIVSPVMVIVTAITAIASFTIPQYSLAIAFRALRFTYMIAAATLGLYGIVLAFIMTTTHMANLKSFGVQYTAPFAPVNLHDMKNSFIRAPFVLIKRRPSFLKVKDERKRSLS